ncbi:MAG: phosphomannomutase/phosphoglucomutase [Xanthomonadales bacterium]
MDLKEKLEQTLGSESERRARPAMIYALGLFGLLLVAAAGWLYFSDASTSRAKASIAQRAEQAAADLAGPVSAVKQLLADEQVQALALRALNDTDTADDLFAYLNGRMGAVRSAAVYGREQADRLNPATLGPNGYALLDLVLSALEGKQALMQVHGVLEPPQVFDATALRDGEEIVGALVIGLDPAPVLGNFRPEASELPFLRLSQYNGRQPATTLAEYGETGGAPLDRSAVPGTMFRLEYPQASYVSPVTGRTLLMLVIVGLLSLAAAFVLNLRFKARPAREAAQARPQPEDAAPAAAAPQAESETAARTELAQPTAEDADFVDLEAAVEAQAADDTKPAAADEAIAEEQPPRSAEAGPPPMHLHYDIAERYRQREAAHEPVALSPEIFRAYDIRGVIDKTLDSGVARKIGQAVGSLVLERDAGPVVVARDGRLSGPYLMDGVIEGVTSTGCDVLDIGAVPTGVMYYAAMAKAAGSGIVITGSHNPPDYNGFKIMVGGDTLHGDAIKDLYRRIEAGELASGEGRHERMDVVPDYIQRIADDVKVEKPLRVVIDCGNGIGGVCAADTLRALGVEVLPLFDEVDGTFPNHHPDPSEPENLQDLIESVRLMDADLGLAFDGDADRLGVVTLAGDIIYPDRIMMLLALDVLDRVPGATILYDVKCTGHLPRVIREAGGDPVMYKTGHSLMKAKMKEVGAPFAGEMSGHFFFGERWYGVDDGIYAAARLLEILGGTDTPPEAILNALPSSFSTPELKVQMSEGENHAFVEEFKEKARFEGAEIHTIDGLRADFDDGWGLVRPSNTTPILVVRFDAETEQALERIKAEFRRQMLALRPDLDLPF